MNNYLNISCYQNHCCGCGECYAICPVNAIEMKLSKEGFYYPAVNNQKCINCTKCVKHCSFNREDKPNNLIAAYALKHSDPEVRAASRSGGVFTALSDIILDAGGVVYGCKLVNCREAIHVRATSKQERDEFRGSKYIQSKTHDIFDSVKNDLQQGVWVLFSGTACQVNAIADYCKDTDCSKLLLVDIVCHGVPSPKVWNDYLDYLSRKSQKIIVSVDFRDKVNFGWADHKETVVFSDGSKHSGNDFTRLFYDHNILRKDCFQCPYRSINRVGDISIADCWGIAQNYPEFDDNKGVSLVLVNTEKGGSFFKQLQHTEFIDVEINKLLQPPLKENWIIPSEYDSFWKYYHRHSFEKVIKKYVLKLDCLPKRALRKLYRLVRRMGKKPAGR